MIVHDEAQVCEADYAAHMTFHDIAMYVMHGPYDCSRYTEPNSNYKTTRNVVFEGTNDD